MDLFHDHNIEKIKEKIDNKSKLGRYIQFAIGCLIVAIAFNLFLAPKNLVSGGVSGFSIILNELLGVNQALTIFVISSCLLVLSYFLLGKVKTRGSILGTILFPLFVQLTSNIGEVIHLDTSQTLLTVIFGGVIYGFGSGMIFKAGFTTGGTDIINQILSKYLKIGMGKSILICDGTIVVLSGIVFGPTNLMYSLILLYLISNMSDRVILGISDSKAFYIVTSEDKKIKDYIMKYLNHGVTVFDAKGGFKKKNEKFLLSVLPTKDYYRLKEGIHEIDPNAFFLVTDAYEVFGGE